MQDHAESLLETELRALLERAGRRGMAFEELAAQAEQIGASSAQVERYLEFASQRGEVVLWGRRWYRTEYTEWRVGQVERFVGGEAVVVCGRIPYHVRRRDLKGARRGDRVLLKRLRARRGKRRGEVRRAAVVRVLARPARRVVGTLSRRPPRRRSGSGGTEKGRWLVPFDSKEELEVLVEGGDELGPDVWVEVELEEGERRDRSERRQRGVAARGRVTEVLGPITEPGVDTDVVIRHFEIPDEVSKGVREEAEGLPEDPDPESFEGRLDLRRSDTVTIDGPSARDFDDAISAVEKGGRLELGVHIADVSHYVEEGSALDREAYRRGTSVYFPERAVPMLPERLSNGLCSLKEGRPRLTVSVLMELGPDGEVLSESVAPSVIRSRRRLTYDEARQILSGERSDEDWLIRLLEVAEKAMRRLLARRQERGSLDFDLPEGDVVLDTDGETVGIRPEERHVAHRIIEELMIAANEAVARRLEEEAEPAFYRVHDPPGGEKLEELLETLRGMGLDTGELGREVTPLALQRLLASVEGRPEESFVSTLVLRSLGRARYDHECLGHFALASDSYTHFTSPIRRYPDLFVHRRIKRLATKRSGAASPVLATLLPAMAQQLSSTERRAERAERELLQWKKVRFLADRVGETFAGIVTGVQSFGLFVRLADYFVDGLVEVGSLGEEYWELDPRLHVLRGGTTGQVWRLGQQVEVRLLAVNERVRGLDLAVLGTPGDSRAGEREPRSSRRGRKGRSRGERHRSGGRSG